MATSARSMRQTTGRITVRSLYQRMVAHEKEDQARHTDITGQVSGIIRSVDGLTKTLNALLDERHEQAVKDQTKKELEEEAAKEAKKRDDRIRRRFYGIITLAGVLVPLLIAIMDHVWK